MELYNYTVHELIDKLEKKEISSEEIVKSYFERINEKDYKIRAYISILEGSAIEHAKKIDKERIAGGNLSKFAGIPIALKDNLCLKGTRTTCSSKILANFVAPYNATVVEKLNENGVIYIGKANMDEFAMGSSTENSAFFTTRNPWDLERVPGGSSGGPAAAVASDICRIGILICFSI